MANPKPVPKPGDPDWVPRHPPLDLKPIDARIAERVAYAEGRDVPAVVADTAMMIEMRREIRNLRLANGILKEVVHVSFQRRFPNG